MRALVVGGGLAGSCAALELRASGAEVVLCHVGAGATAFCGGPIDFAPASALVGEVAPTVAGCLETPAKRLERCVIRFPNHPYATLFAGHDAEQIDAQIVGAIARLNAWLEPEALQVGGSLRSTALFAGTDGSLRAGDFALQTVAAGDLRNVPRVALAAFPGLAYWQPEVAAGTLSESLRGVGLSATEVRVVTPEWPAAWLDAAADPSRLAALIDRHDGVELFLGVLRPFLDAGRTLLVPPLLGLDPKKESALRIAAAALHPIAELVASAPESSVGFRFDRALRAALLAAGVELRLSAVASLVTDSPVETLRGARFESGESEAFDVFVLATGRFSSGGLVERDGCVAEPLLDLPLFDASGARTDGHSPRQLTRPGYDEAQPLYGSGVRIDACCRPLGLDGRRRFLNLFAAGDLVGGFDPARDRTGYGVALLTGLFAGRGAAGQPREGG